MNDKQIQEIVKCGKDPQYFIDTYVKIQHPIKGLVQFKTFKYQRDCLKEFQEHRYNIVLKSRQLGLSTVSAAYALWLTLFYRDKNILVIATKLPTAINFVKKVKIALDNLPPWLVLPKVKSETKSEISFDNGSQVKAVPNSEDAGRSEALSLLIVDECAHIERFAEVYAALQPTLSMGGSAIIISTPNGTVGKGKKYYEIWTEAEAGQNDYNPIRLEWHVHPEHDKKWFEEQKRQLNDPKKVAQELLCDFATSGDTYLQPSDLNWVRDCIREPIHKECDGKLWFWEMPNSECRYIISSDVARGDAHDYSTFHVINYDECTIVAEFMGKLPPDRLGELLISWGTKYNNAVIIPEKNTFGYMTNIKLKDEGYKYVYYKNQKRDLFEPYNEHPENEVPGFDTQAKIRAQILSKLEEVIRNKTLNLYSRRLYEQLHTFEWTNGKVQASKSNSDDLVMSAAIGVWMLNITTPAQQTHVDDSNILYAMLKATSKQNVSKNEFKAINEVKPISLSGINQTKPMTADTAQRMFPNQQFNFNWLLR